MPSRAASGAAVCDGAAQRRDVDGVDGVAGEAVGDAARPGARPSGASAGSPWPSTSGNGLPGHQRLGLAVADEEQLGRAGRPAEAGLAVLRLRSRPRRWRRSLAALGRSHRTDALVRLGARMSAVRHRRRCSPPRSPCRPTPTPRTRGSASAPPCATASGRIYAGVQRRERLVPGGHLRRGGGDRGDGRGGRAGDRRGPHRRRRRRLTTCCGGCRQRIREFAARRRPVHAAGPDGVRRTFTLASAPRLVRPRAPAPLKKVLKVSGPSLAPFLPRKS